MKFKNGCLDYVDAYGDKLEASLTIGGCDEFLIIRTTGGREVIMDREEARKFAKAIRKQVKLADEADGWMD